LAHAQKKDKSSNRTEIHILFLRCCSHFPLIAGIDYSPSIYYKFYVFKRFPEAVFTEDNKQIYKTILLTTNTHKRNHSAHKPIMSNKEYKYKYIIGLLVFIHKTEERMQV